MSAAEQRKAGAVLTEPGAQGVLGHTRGGRLLEWEGKKWDSESEGWGGLGWGAFQGLQHNTEMELKAPSPGDH